MSEKGELLFKGIFYEHINDHDKLVEQLILHRSKLASLGFFPKHVYSYARCAFHYLTGLE